jgi:hypothetical protein
MPAPLSGWIRVLIDIQYAEVRVKRFYRKAISGRATSTNVTNTSLVGREHKSLNLNSLEIADPEGLLDILTDWTRTLVNAGSTTGLGDLGQHRQLPKTTGNDDLSEPTFLARCARQRRRPYRPT